MKNMTIFSNERSETVLLIDSWKDQESIDVHHASPMMNTIAELREKYDLHMRAERYISDDESISDADKNLSKSKQKKQQVVLERTLQKLLS